MTLADELRYFPGSPISGMAEWLPVRCCCTPNKIFGFLRVPAKPRDAGGVLLVSHKWMAGQIPVQVRPLTDYSSGGSTEYAIYSEDRPREFWSGVVGFVEVP